MPIRTAPARNRPATFSVALMGCAFSSADRTTWNHVLARTVPQTGRKIDYLNWGGDWHYGDRRFDKAKHHQELFESAWYRVSGLREILHQTPLIADQLSDHDGGEGGNNRNSYQSRSVAACRRAVAQMVPSPEPEVPDCRFSTTLLGRVLFLSLDTRSVYRSRTGKEDGPRKTLLGKPQREALFRWLDIADASNYLAVIQSDMVWDGDTLGGKLDWWGSYPTERKLVADQLTGRRVIICDYDLHALRIKNESAYGGVPVIGSAGATANSNSRSDSAEYYDQIWPDPTAEEGPTRHWQELVFTDDGESITVDVTGFDPRETNPARTAAKFRFAAALI